MSLIDHVITNGERYFSFREAGLIALKRVRETVSRRKPKLPVIERPEAPGFGRLADYEAFPSGSDKLPRIDEPERIRHYATTLKTADPDHHHAVFLDAKLRLRSVVRLPASLKQDAITERILDAAMREGAYAFTVAFAAGPVAAYQSTILQIIDAARAARLQCLDAHVSADWAMGRSTSLREAGLMEPAAQFGASMVAQEEEEELQLC